MDTETTQAPTQPMQIVVGYDFSESAHVALSRAIAHAESHPQHLLHLLAVLDDKGSLGVVAKGKADYSAADDIHEMVIKDVEARLKAANPSQEIHFFVHVRIGAPADEILDLAREVGAHLIIVGSHGRTGLKRVLMGSVSEKVVREARCPVLVARDREYQDVQLTPVVDAPEGHAEQQPYNQPHRYSYSNQMIARQKSSWPWY